MMFLASWACLLPTVAASTSFLVMGDWGGDEDRPYCTPSETETAAGMESVSKSIGSKFGLALGDNFYHSGVTSVDDARFKETFEDVFTGDSLSATSGFKFHVVAGNHDWRGNVSAQIAYSAKSPRWVFPDYYYTFTESSDDGATIQFVMLDTVKIAGNSQVEQPSGEEINLPGDQLPGPLVKDDADKEVQWVEQTLSQSKADYLIVAGHYPVYSVCEHGPTPLLQQRIKPLLEKYKVTAYLAGHDHCSEHINVGDGVEYHGIGSAAYHVKSIAHIDTIEKSQLKYHDAEDGGGFASVIFSKASMLLTHHDGKGNHLYNNTMMPRKSLSLVV